MALLGAGEEEDEAAGVKDAEALRFFGGGAENWDFGLFCRCL